MVLLLRRTLLVKFKIRLQIYRLRNFEILKFRSVEVRSKILKQGLRTKIFVQIRFSYDEI